MEHVGYPHEPGYLYDCPPCERIMANTSTLNDVMEFERVIQVHRDGTVTTLNDVWAPEMHDGEVQGYDHIDSQPNGWRLMTGYTGQHGYHGPNMHASEFIGGTMARDILATPGIYVALVDYPSDDSEPESWGVAYIHD